MHATNLNKHFGKNPAKITDRCIMLKYSKFKIYHLHHYANYTYMILGCAMDHMDHPLPLDACMHAT